MDRFKNILCVVEPSEEFRPALERAVTLAANNLAQLTVVEVIPRAVAGYTVPDSGPVSNASQEALLADRLPLLQSFTQPYHDKLTIQHEVRIGSGFLEVIRMVVNKHYDLVIKRAEDPKHLTRIAGSDDMHLLRKCPCPVWLTKPGEKTDYKTIIAAVDFDLDRPSAEQTPNRQLNTQIMELASSLAVSDFATLHVVHAWDVPDTWSVRKWAEDQDSRTPTYLEDEHTLHQQYMDELQEQLQEQIGEEAYGHLAPEFQLLRGDPVTVIPETAKNLQADIVVMGTVARSGVEGLFIGNTAENILEQLNCSVLAVKPPGFVTPVKAR